MKTCLAWFCGLCFALCSFEALAQEPPKTTVYYLKHAQAADAAQTIKELYSDFQEAGKAKIVAEERTNSLLISAPDKLVKEIEDLIKVLDADVKGVLTGLAPQNPDAKAHDEVKVFSLMNADAGTAKEIVTELTGNDLKLTADPRTNSLIVTGTKQDVMIVEAILLRLDERSDQKLNSIRVYPLKHASIEKATQTLSLLGLGVNLAFDTDHNRLIARGDESAHKMLAEMLQTIDVPASEPSLKRMQLRIVWLVDEKLAGKDAAAPSKNLDKVLKVLDEKLGVTNLKTAAQILVTIDPASDSERRFDVNGTTSIQDNLNVQLEAVGQVLGQAGPNPTIELSIHATKPRSSNQSGFGGGARGGSSSDTLTSLTTKVAAPAGHSIVLGMTPIQSANSVFVLQVLSDE